MCYRLLIGMAARAGDDFARAFAYRYTCLYCLLSRSPASASGPPPAPIEIMGLSFPGPVGLAAGFDRDGALLRHLPATGLGHVEIGTINIDSEKGSEPHATRVLRRLEHASIACPKGQRRQLWGISLGSLDHALARKSAQDYARGMELFWRHADYLVINLSRPGSPARAVRPRMETLSRFFHSLMRHHGRLNTGHAAPPPIIVKIAVDHSRHEQLMPMLLLIQEQGFDGAIIAFENWPDITSICDYLATLRAQLASFPLIVVGGIRSRRDAGRILNAGASLVQIHTSFVRRGPAYVRSRLATLRVRRRFTGKPLDHD